MYCRRKHDRRLGGKKRQLTPTGKSVSVSFRVRVVRASGRGEAAWACDVLLNAGGSAGKMCASSSGLVSLFGLGLVSIAICEGFKRFL